MRNHRLLFAGLLALCCCAYSSAAPAPKLALSDAKPSFTPPFDLVDNRVFIEVSLNGRGPFHFLLDTGAGGLTISADVAQQLGLHVGDAGEGQGVGEKVVRAGQAQIAQVQIGELTLANLESHVMDLSDAPQVFGTKRFHGIIGLPVFERTVVKHDYVDRVLTFTSPDKFDYPGAGVIVRFERPRQIPMSPLCSMACREISAWIPARARRCCSMDHSARRTIFRKNMDPNWKASRAGASGDRCVRCSRARELQIGDVIVPDLVIRLSAQKTGLTTSSAMAGLIGPDVLSQFDVTFDYARSHIIFEKNKIYGRRDSYDRAGIWMGQDQDGKHLTVVDAIAGGPGAAAGVKPGDEVLAINGENTANLILPDVRETIRREAVGEKLTLLLESSSKQRTAVVILKDLV